MMKRVKVIIWSDFWKKALSLTISIASVLITVFWLMVSMVATSFFFKMVLSLSWIDGLMFWFLGFLVSVVFSNETIVKKLRKYNSMKIVKYIKVE